MTLVLDRARLQLGLPMALGTLVLDQLSKWAMLQPLNLPAVQHIPMLEVGPFALDLTMVWNRGVTFGLLWGDSFWAQLLLARAASGIALFLLRWMARAETAWVAVALGAVVGGAIGNVIDRLRFGAVVDFLDFHINFASGPWNWYVFNVADAGIVCGVGVLVADALFRREPKAK